MAKILGIFYFLTLAKGQVIVQTWDYGHQARARKSEDIVANIRKFLGQYF